MGNLLTLHGIYYFILFVCGLSLTTSKAGIAGPDYYIIYKYISYVGAVGSSDLSGAVGRHPFHLEGDVPVQDAVRGDKIVRPRHSLVDGLAITWRVHFFVTDPGLAEVH